MTDTYCEPMMTQPYPTALYNSRFFVWQTHMYGTGRIDSLGKAAELANLAGKMIGSAKVQVEYYALRKEQPRIKWLESTEPTST